MRQVDIERNAYKELLQVNGYASVQFGLSSSDMVQCFQEFNDFLQLCEEPDGRRLSEALRYKPQDRSAGGDYWLEQRRIGKVNPHSINLIPSTEDKDVAHVGPISYGLASGRLGRRMPAVMHQFLQSCIELHEAAKTSVKPFLTALGLSEGILASNPIEDQHVVRLIRYLGTSANLKAGLHFDRSAVTLAAWESHPGLIGVPAQNSQRRSVAISELDERAEAAHSRPINHHRGLAKVFLGAGYNRLNDGVYNRNGELPLLLHGVRNERPTEERFAAVVFMHPPAHFPGYEVPNKDETSIDGVREYILRRKPPIDDSAVA